MSVLINFWWIAQPPLRAKFEGKNLQLCVNPFHSCHTLFTKVNFWLFSTASKAVWSFKNTSSFTSENLRQKALHNSYSPDRQRPKKVLSSTCIRRGNPVKILLRCARVHPDTGAHQVESTWRQRIYNTARANTTFKCLFVSITGCKHYEIIAKSIRWSKCSFAL